jgi:hypothetical protein
VLKNPKFALCVHRRLTTAIEPTDQQLQALLPVGRRLIAGAGHERGAEMKTSPVMILLFLSVFVCSVQLAAETREKTATTATASAILNCLKTEHGEELHQFLSSLRGVAGTSEFGDDEIDPIIAELVRIQDSDPYQKDVAAAKDSADRKVTVFPNRMAARERVFRFQFQKIANALRQLPLGQRVAGIVDGIEHPPTTLQYESVELFKGELIRAGKDAVPFIIQHKPKQPYHRRAIVQALAAIGDQRGIDYIIEVLKSGDESFQFERPIAAKALGEFDDKEVKEALVDALKDETFQEIDRHQPQSVHVDHNPYVGRYYSVQHAAAKSLTRLTGKDWGLLYNEDYGTWAAWLHSENPDTFSPNSVVRTDAEVARLVESLFHRYMSARPNPWQPQNALDTPEGVRSVSADLKQLGPRVVLLLVNSYRARVSDTPLWRDELRKWTNSLLEELGWEEAKEAAQTALK